MNLATRSIVHDDFKVGDKLTLNDATVEYLGHGIPTVTLWWSVEPQDDSDTGHTDQTWVSEPNNVTLTRSFVRQIKGDS
jgi:hypothetical protein